MSQKKEHHAGMAWVLCAARGRWASENLSFCAERSQEAATLGQLSLASTCASGLSPSGVVGERPQIPPACDPRAGVEPPRRQPYLSCRREREGHRAARVLCPRTACGSVDRWHRCERVVLQKQPLLHYRSNPAGNPAITIAPSSPS